jgi:recombination protein RecT
MTDRPGLREQASAGQGQTNGSQVEKRQTQALTIGQRIEKLEHEFARALPAGDAAQLVQDAITCTRVIRNLDKAEPRSVLGALMTAAQLGLRPGLNGHCWPLPFWNSQLEWVDPQTGRKRKGGYQAQLVIGYQGVIHLGYESGLVASIQASVVRDRDDWDWDEGSGQRPMHKRPKLGQPRGPIIGYYATVETTTGGLLVYVMDVPEILQWRDRHAPRNKEGMLTGPWAGDPESDDFIGMAKKTTILRVAKTMPKSAQFSRAAAVDGSVRVDVSAIAEPEVVSSVALTAGPDGAEPQDSIRGETVDAGTEGPA